jgi:hypothetical protein
MTSAINGDRNRSTVMTSAINGDRKSVNGGDLVYRPRRKIHQTVVISSIKHDEKSIERYPSGCVRRPKVCRRSMPGWATGSTNLVAGDKMFATFD